MGKYLKMADVFGVGVSVRDKAPRLIECGGVLAANCLCERSAEYTAHAINSHDELVENALHYEADALMWERRAVTEASRAQELVAEVERLREALQDLMDWTLKNSTAYDCQPYNAARRLLNK